MYYINDLPEFLLKRCSSIKEISIFCLPAISNTQDNNNLWKNIVRIKLIKLLKKNKQNHEIDFITYNITNSFTCFKKIKLNNDNLINLIDLHLKCNEIVLIHFFNDLGYLIIPRNHNDSISN